jgi:hypothetical protein
MMWPTCRRGDDHGRQDGIREAKSKEGVNGEFDDRDAGAGKIYGDKNIRNLMTVFGGDLVFDPWGLNAVFWKDVPRRSRTEGADLSDDMNADQRKAPECRKVLEFPYPA